MKKSSLYIIYFFVLSLNIFSKSTFSSDRLKEECLKYVRSVVGQESEIIVSDDIVSQEFKNDDVKAKFKSLPNSLKGNAYVTVEFVSNSKIIRKINIPVRIKVFKNVSVAKRSILQGTIINYDDYELRLADVTNYKESDLADYNSIIGKIAKHNIKEDGIIITGHLQNVKTIIRGDKVIIISASGPVVIKTTGVALNDAEEGKEVRVKREGANVILIGTAGIDKIVYLR